MNYFVFLLNSILVGCGLAMDAFSVSLANGLNDPKMKSRRMITIAGIFAIFQGIMPLLGWICIKTAANYFPFLETLIPWIALVLLGFIGGKMIYESAKCGCDEDCKSELTFGALMVQGIATSIDALSAGLTISSYNFLSALISSLIIAAVTFVICFIGLAIGKKSGTYLAGKAGILGGIILIVIGLEIFITGIF